MLQVMFVLITARQVGGGLLAGLGLLGAGYFAYKEHEKSDDEVRRGAVPNSIPSWQLLLTLIFVRRVEKGERVGTPELGSRGRAAHPRLL